MAVVGHDEDLVHVPQRMLIVQWFVVESVEVSAGDSLLLERRYQRRFLDDSTSPDIDQIGGRFHGGEGFVVQQAFGFCSERGSDHDVIG